MIFFPRENRIDIDLHGYTIEEAKMLLEETLETTPINIYALVVIHGHSTGILTKYIRKEFSHKRIEKKITDINPGITIFKLDMDYTVDLRKKKRKR